MKFRLAISSLVGLLVCAGCVRKNLAITDVPDVRAPVAPGNVASAPNDEPPFIEGPEGGLIREAPADPSAGSVTNNGGPTFLFPSVTFKGTSN